MLTYGNGEMCSKLLFNAINQNYLARVTSYFSLAKECKNLSPATAIQPYITKDGCYIKQYPPSGDTIRDMFDEATSSPLNPWGISDKERYTREIQSVQCHGGIFAQDHTFQPVRNYQKSLGAVAVWDVATSTGEIATAVLVTTTQTKDFSHAAIQLSKRTQFTPAVMYSDTWPNKKEYWDDVFPGIEGRLGLFDFEKRITSTLRKGHIDFMEALSGLLDCLYENEPNDYENVLKALKDGSLSPTGNCLSSSDIADLQATKLFRVRYNKYIRKK
jgi:hypothetical protein